jgi:hypothetical protein
MGSAAIIKEQIFQTNLLYRGNLGILLVKTIGLQMDKSCLKLHYGGGPIFNLMMHWSIPFAT